MASSARPYWSPTNIRQGAICCIPSALVPEAGQPQRPPQRRRAPGHAPRPHADERDAALPDAVDEAPPVAGGPDAQAPAERLRRPGDPRGLRAVADVADAVVLARGGDEA